MAGWWERQGKMEDRRTIEPGDLLLSSIHQLALRSFVSALHQRNRNLNVLDRRTPSSHRPVEISILSLYGIDIRWQSTGFDGLGGKHYASLAAP